LKLIFDIGLFDGADTEYYLQNNFRVVAVEANPSLINEAKKKFSSEIETKQLTLIHAAISENSGENIILTVCGDDIGASSIYEQRIDSRNPIGSFQVETINIKDLINIYGTPYFIKVDIEGADRFCVLPLTKDLKPEYFSFEAGDDFIELAQHLKTIGFSKFKMINQGNFRELKNQNNLKDKLKSKIVRLLGYEKPTLIRRSGRFFIRGHSSGPAPWESDGNWQTLEQLISSWENVKKNNQLTHWYDIHAH